MKYARFQVGDNERYGIVEGEELLELYGSPLGDHGPNGNSHRIADVKLLPPVAPTKIVCIGQNYIEHIKELGVTPPSVPLFFLKPPSSLIGPGDAIVYPRMAQRVDYEGELAVVIKKTMKNVPAGEALNYVFGYSCFNDVTERKLASENPFNLTISKSFDTFSALGPYVATDLDGDNLALKTTLNGKVMQADSTKNCIFGIKKLLEYLSQCLTLCPGDIVTTGTPKGIAPMRVGDLVEVEIEGIGILKNRVEAA